MGSNMAEAHPVAFRWALKAREAGGVLIHIDPRFTRTSALADVHVAIRAGSDVAFLGGVLRYIIENERYFREYVLKYTNASFIITDQYVDAEDGGGYFDGYDAASGQYDLEPKGWSYEHRAGYRLSTGDEAATIEQDDTLNHPRCVFQLLRKHYSRYTPENVAEI